MNTIGENIKNYRTFRKMTQVELGAAVGRSKNVVSNWERGDNTPDLDTLEKICRVLGVTPNQIFGWDICPEYEEHKQKIASIQNKYEEVKKRRDEINREIQSLKQTIRGEEAAE